MQLKCTTKFESKESLCNVMSEIYKHCDAKKKKKKKKEKKRKRKQVSKDYFNNLKRVVINSVFSNYLLVSVFISRISRDSISLILKENNSISAGVDTHLCRLPWLAGRENFRFRMV